MFDKIMDVQNDLQADYRISLSLSDKGEGEIGDKADAGKRYETLKQPIVMHWNSLLNLIVNILYSWHEMSKALKRTGEKEYCLSENDKELLVELREFLNPYQAMTKLVRSGQLTLGLVPFIIKEVRDRVKHKGESEIIRELKDNVASKIDKRITITETVEIAVLLDPAMKDLIIAEKSEDSVKQLLKEKTLKVVQSINAEVESSNTGATANVNKNLKLNLNLELVNLLHHFNQLLLLQN